MKRTILFGLVLTGLLLATVLAYQPLVPTNARAAGPPPAGVPTVPLYRLFAPSTGIHFYTTDENRKQESLGTGWTSEGIAAHILSQQAPGTVPLYVLFEKLSFNSKEGNPIFGYTTSEAEKNQLLNNPGVPELEGGWVNDGGHWHLDGNGIAGYIASTQLSGTVPLFRLYHPPVFGPEETEGTVGGAIQVFNRVHFRKCRPSSYDNFYTTSAAEKDKALSQFGYKFFRIEGYVWPQATTVIPHVGPGKPTDPDTELLKQGCTRSGTGAYGCSTPSSYELCESYRRNGHIKNCWFSGDQKVLDQQAAMDKDLFSVGCKRFLNRPDEFTCKTPKALEACYIYLLKKQVKKCMQSWK
jgi:hypothetical protein